MIAEHPGGDRARPRIPPRAKQGTTVDSQSPADALQDDLDPHTSGHTPKRDIFLLGFVVAKDLTPLVAAGCHMVHSPFVLDPLRPRRTPMLLTPASLRQHSCSLQACFNA